MSRWHAWLLTACLAGGAVAVGVLAPGLRSPAAPGAPAANRAVYRDGTGEDTAALDIDTVRVRSDDLGLLAFEIRFAGRGLRPADDRLLITIDTDANPRTGSPAGGIEWILAYCDGRPLLSVYFEGVWAAVPPAAASLRAIPGERSVTLRLNARDVYSPAGIRFAVETRPAATGDAEVLSVPGRDRAPDRGMWRYAFRTYVAPALTAGPAVCRPDPPRAGRTLVATVAVHVARGGVPERLGSAAKVVGVATVGGRRIAGTPLAGSRAGSVAVSFRVPAGTRGAILRGSVQVTLEGVSIRRSFVERVV